MLVCLAYPFPENGKFSGKKKINDHLDFRSYTYQIFHFSENFSFSRIRPLFQTGPKILKINLEKSYEYSIILFVSKFYIILKKNHLIWIYIRKVMDF